MGKIKSSLIVLLVIFTGTYANAWEYGGDPEGLPYEKGLGTQLDPYIIATAQQLANLAYSVNRGQDFAGMYFKLANDIDLNPGITFEPDNENSYTLAAQWTPIGMNAYFCGNFDGDGHTIRGLYFNGDNVIIDYNTNARSIVDGLFGNIKDSTLSNLTIANSLMAYSAKEGDFTSITSAFFAAQSVESHFINLRNEGNVRVKYIDEKEINIGTEIAGIVCSVSPSHTSDNEFLTIKGCDNYGTMRLNVSSTSYSYPGYSRGAFCGIVFYGYNTSISNCRNYGALDGNIILDCAGIGSTCTQSDSFPTGYDNLSNDADISGCESAGLFLLVRAKELTNCYNTGYISNGSGLVGHSIIERIENCYNTGDVRDLPGLGSHQRYVGGLIGFSESLSEIIGCYNTGTVSSIRPAGGILGGNSVYDSTEMIIYDCKNEGNVTGSGYAGGIACHVAYGSISSSSNSGDITVTMDNDGRSGAGGIVGYFGVGSESNFIEKSINTGDITGESNYIGGICGHFSPRLIECYNTGDVSGRRYVGGLSGSSITDGVTPMLNCYNTGNVSGDDFVAGLCPSISGPAKYCFNYGKINCNSDNKGLLWIYSYFAYIQEMSSACYALFQDGFDVARIDIGAENTQTERDGCEIRTKEEFGNGLVCILLNDKQNPTPWGQIPGTDPYPLLNGKGNPEIDGIDRVEFNSENPFHKIVAISGHLISTKSKKIQKCLPTGLYIINGKKVFVK